MIAQSQILRTLRASAPKLLRITDAEGQDSRTALSRQVCEGFGFVDARGRLQQAGCLKALKTLAAEGTVALPASKRVVQGPIPRVLDTPVPEPVGVPSSLKEIAGLAVELVEDAGQRAIWNTLMAAEHPRGTTMFAGAQVRYLFRSVYGYLGAVGFSASALYLKPRDAWMAWTHAQRQAHLHRVVGLSRFLIRPGVKVKVLASHLLGKVLKRLPVDFERRYRYRPWLVETFVARPHRGTCFKAANFKHVGTTSGRGRHARTRACTKSRKAVYVYELDPRWRQYLGVPYVETQAKLTPGEGLDSDRWTAQEFGGAPLGDKRLSVRLEKSVAILARTPGHSMTANMDVDHAAVQGYYRFIGKPDTSAVTPENILAPHRARTIERMRTQSTVLCVQDGTDINFASRPQCEGLEVIGRNQTTAKTQGVHLHATLAHSPAGLPLGLLRCAYGAAKTQGVHPPKTQRWIDGLQDVAAAASQLTCKTRVICVTDREGDIFALFDAQRKQPRVHLLVRARHDRCLEPNRKLFATMRKGPAAGTIAVPIARLSRRAKSGRLTHQGRTGRIATMEVRYRSVMLPPTGGQVADPVRVATIHLREIAPPEGNDPVEWYLLTSVEITSLEQAVEMVGYYAQRWRIEDGFRILKSGCKVEQLRMQKASALHRAITINAVIAWRLLLLTLLGRQVPEAAAEVLFTDTELQALREYAHRYRLSPPKDLASATLVMAIMGGYMNRKHDGPPGPTILWRGYQRLLIRAMMYTELTLRYHLVKKRPIQRE